MMADKTALEEFTEIWAMLGWIAEQYNENIEKRKEALDAIRTKQVEAYCKVKEARETLAKAEEALRTTLADAKNTLQPFDDALNINLGDVRKYLSRIKNLVPNEEIRDHVVWKLNSYEWDDALIIEAFEISEDEYKAIVLRGNQEVLHTMPYKEYLQTPEWKERRQRILERDGYKCQVCNSPAQLNVHHRDYARRGYENDSDLITLCQNCHQIFHENRKLVKA